MQSQPQLELVLPFIVKKWLAFFHNIPKNLLILKFFGLLGTLSLAHRKVTADLL